MKTKLKAPTKARAAPGPKPELLTIKANWKRAIKQSLAKKKPPGGWPR